MSGTTVRLVDNVVVDGKEEVGEEEEEEEGGLGICWGETSMQRCWWR